MSREWPEDEAFIYPCTIVRSRYGGAYEKGVWFALNEDEDCIPVEATGGDIECMIFWKSDAANRIGRGNTPNEAYQDLVRRLEAQKDEER